MKKFNSIFFILIIFFVLSCNDDEGGNDSKEISSFPTPEEINLNQTYSKIIDPKGENLYVFTAESLNHKITVSNIISEVGILLFEYVPTNIYEDQLNFGSLTFYVDVRVDPHKIIITEKFVPGVQYLIMIREWDRRTGSYDFRVSD